MNTELRKCSSKTKQEIATKTLHFAWIYYLEIPVSYKNRSNNKIMLKPVSDAINCTIFHYTLESLFKTDLDFNTVVNSNFNELIDYLLTMPISVQNILL